ncbi:MAG: GTP-binding protein [Myxococcota bacterium]|nr:GTP-binding protein [Myxococcota bacterium]
MARTPLHLVTGFLGSGKTSLLLNQLETRQEQERCAVVVNDFGEARIDATLLSGKATIQEIPGGCVCCTAPEDLAPSVEALLAQEPPPDRIFIEATGLARPADILDTLSRSKVAAQLELAPVVGVLDPRRLKGLAPALLLEQLDAADVLILNFGDQCDVDTLEAAKAATADHFPPWLAVVETRSGKVDPGLFDLRRQGPGIRVHKPGLSTAGYAAASQTWEPEVVFDQKALRAVLADCGAERVKGLFHTDLGWTLMERAGGQVHARPTGLRSTSAVDVIVKGDASEATGLLGALDAARYSEDPSVLGELRLSDGGSYRARLNRWSLAALPGQIADVAERVPKRAGQAVYLREIVGLLHPMEGAQVVLVAADGMVSGPTPVGELGDAMVLHSVDGAPVPEDKGGPFRVLVPPEDGQSACANVKKLVRIELVEA